MKTKRILTIPYLKIHNANALSSPYTVGFPAMTAWLGAVHALERQLKASAYPQLHFKSMGVVCHRIDLQTYKGRGDYVYSIIGTGNPLDKKGNRPSFIEEARCHLTVSFIIEYDGLGLADREQFKEHVEHQLQSKMKIAGGDILSLSTPELGDISSEKEVQKLMRQLMPGYCVIERRDLMQTAMTKDQDAMDALLTYLKIFNTPEKNDKGDITWRQHRQELGWIIPIATGFHGISELGKAENQRDENTPHRFAESIVTLGQFVMPYRMKDLDNMLWHYHTDLENNLYYCQQNKPSTEF
ncbi:MAG: type I-F CRISPR-associated protein Csy2 [Cocleimonas sp.]|nr:type I-F CRISPR-associated protein Csy2 [Cocleimonas sp.]